MENKEYKNAAQEAVDAELEKVSGGVLATASQTNPLDALKVETPLTNEIFVARF